MNERKGTTRYRAVPDRHIMIRFSDTLLSESREMAGPASHSPDARRRPGTAKNSIPKHMATVAITVAASSAIGNSLRAKKPLKDGVNSTIKKTSAAA